MTVLLAVAILLPDAVPLGVIATLLVDVPDLVWERVMLHDAVCDGDVLELADCEGVAERVKPLDAVSVGAWDDVAADDGVAVSDTVPVVVEEALPESVELGVATWLRVPVPEPETD